MGKTDKVEIGIVGFNKSSINWFQSKHPLMGIKSLRLGDLLKLEESTLRRMVIVWSLADNVPQKGNMERAIKELLQQSRPIVYCHRRPLKIYEQVLLFLGYECLSGKAGLKVLKDLVNTISAKKADEIIASVRVSDVGLSVTFGDGVTATIPLSEVRLLSELNDILWNTIRISNDRSHLLLDVMGHDPIPLPWDVLREYVEEEKPQRIQRYQKEINKSSKTFGIRLRTIRKKVGITQELLSERAHSSRWTIIRIERGDYLPKLKLLENITHALGIELEELLG